MTNRHPRPGFLWQVFCVLAVVSLSAVPSFSRSKKKSASPEPPHLRATIQPSFSIPAEPLGFSAPGDFYLGMRNALVSLDFLDEDRLLFTFRVPGLIRRDGANADTRDERRIRAVVLRLPQGAVESETVWTVHDHARYITMLDHGEFLFRDRNNLLLGDASLQLKPFLRFPGPLIAVELDPSRQYIVANSIEPPSSKPAAGEVQSPTSAAAHVTTDQQGASESSGFVVRILRRDTGKVMLVSHVQAPVHLPINQEGYLESLRANGAAWRLNFNHFNGGSTLLGSVDSACSPKLDFISPAEFLAAICGPAGDPRLVALSTSGHRLWEDPSYGPSVWPLLVSNLSGSRLASETLLATHEVSASAPLGTEDIKGQDVRVLDAASGKLALRAAATPIFDAGGNVAISPSGQRVAVIMEGAIQFFNLPTPPGPAVPPVDEAGR